MYTNQRKTKKWSPLASLIYETGNALKETALDEDPGSSTAPTGQIKGLGSVIPELYQLALDRQWSKSPGEDQPNKTSLPEPQPSKNIDLFKPQSENETVSNDNRKTMPHLPGMPEKWTKISVPQSETFDFDHRVRTLNTVDNFISSMGLEEQAALRGVDPMKWKTMVVDRLNNTNMYADEFELLEQYYGLTFGGDKSSTASTTTGSKNKMSYAEYRARMGSQKVNDLNAALQQYFSDYQAFVNAATQDLESVDYDNAASMRGTWSQASSELRQQADELLSILKTSGDIIDGDYNDLISQISLTKQGVDDINNVFAEQEKYYSQWESEDAYQEAMAAQKEWDDLMNFNVAAGWWEIDRLEAVLEEYKELTRWEQPEAGRQREEWLRNKYGSISDLEALISEKKAYIRRAEYLQEGQKLASVTANEDFDIYNGYVSTQLDRGIGNVFSQYSMGYDDLTYEYINGSENGMRDKIIRNGVIYERYQMP